MMLCENCGIQLWFPREFLVRNILEGNDEGEMKINTEKQRLFANFFRMLTPPLWRDCGEAMHLF